MDDTAQGAPSSAVQQPNAQQPTSVPPAATQGGQSQPPVPPSGQVIQGGRPEQGSSSISVDAQAAVAPTPDDQGAKPDEVSSAVDTQREVADVQMQESQPAVELVQEVKDAGVKEGEDAAKEQLPDEQLSVGQQAAQQAPASDAQQSDLPMPQAKAEETTKKSGIRDSLKWFAFLVIYQWKKLKFEEKKEEKKE